MKRDEEFIVYCFRHNETFATDDQKNEHLKLFACQVSKIPKRFLIYMQETHERHKIAMNL